MNHLMFLRIQRGLTQKGLAELLGLNSVTMCRVENGWYAKPPAGLEERVQAVFGKEWTFKKLMESVPDLHGTGDAA